MSVPTKTGQETAKKNKHGFYVVGFFSKGKKARIHFCREKPFEFDSYNGEVHGKVFRFMECNAWANNWEFYEGNKISDLNHDEELRNFVNDTWQKWCKEHKRKYTPVMLPLKKNEVD